MKILVLYFSGKGTTKEMAELVAEGAAAVDGAEVRLRSVDEADADDLFWCEGIALGAPTYLGTVPWQMKKWWEDHTPATWMKTDGRLGCVFTSSGGTSGGGEIAILALLSILMNFGFLVFGATDYVAPGTTLHYGVTLARRPSRSANREGDSEACRRLGRRLAEWVGVYFHGRSDLHPLNAPYSRRPVKPAAKV